MWHCKYALAQLRPVDLYTVFLNQPCGDKIRDTPGICNIPVNANNSSRIIAVVKLFNHQLCRMPCVTSEKPKSAFVSVLVIDTVSNVVGLMS